MRLGEEGKIVSVADQDGFDSFLPEALHYWAPDKAVSKTAIEIYTLYHHTEKTAAAGVTVPTTLDTAWKWDAFVTAADKLTKDKGGRSPSESGFDPGNVAQYGVLFGTDLQLLCGFLQSNNIELFDDAGSRCQIDSPEAIEVIQALERPGLRAPGRPQRHPDAVPRREPRAAAGQWKVAMVIGGQWSLLDLSRGQEPVRRRHAPHLRQARDTHPRRGERRLRRLGLEEQASELLIWLASPDQVDLFSTGLWMPLQSKFYTDEKLLTSWTEQRGAPGELPHCDDRADVEVRDQLPLVPAEELVRDLRASRQRYRPAVRQEVRRVEGPEGSGPEGEQADARCLPRRSS